MAAYFDCLCRSCERGIFILDERSDPDDVKIARMHCPWCTSKDVRVEALDDAYYERYPEEPLPKEEGKLYPAGFTLDDLKSLN